MSEAPDRLGHMTTMTRGADLDVPGLVRRARREADLSQRELADVLEVDQSTVARWETGRSVPDVLQFARVLALGELALQVVDAEGEAAAPMTDQAPRDQQGRRFPAHLDLFEEDDPRACGYRFTSPHRGRRDALRRRDGPAACPADHPSRAEFRSRRRALITAKGERLAALVKRAQGHPPPEVPPCSCPLTCEEQRRCAPGCGCECEGG